MQQRNSTGRPRRIPGERAESTGTGRGSGKAGPATKPLTLPGAAQARSNYAANRVLRKLIQGDAPPTAPMSLVERLAGSPYANPTIRVDAVEDSARKTLDFALELAESLFRYGAGALEVETSVIAVTASLGLRNVDVDINNQSVTINYAGPYITPITVLRVVRSWSDNYAALADLHRLVSDIIVGDLDRDTAGARMQEITSRHKPFPRWAVRLASAGFTTTIVLFLGGGLVACLLSFVSTVLVTVVQQRLGAWRIPEFFTVAAASAIIAGLAQVAGVAHIPVAQGLVIAGGLILLLPTMRLVSATQDAVNGFPVSAAGRYLSAMLVFAAVAAGIAISLVVGVNMGVPRMDVDVTSAINSPPWPVMVILSAVSAVLIAIVLQTRPDLLLPTAGVTAAAYLVMVVAGWTGFGQRLAPAVASVFIGMAARVVALRMNAPSAVIAIPSIMFMFPGMSIFQAVYGISIEGADLGIGATTLFYAMTVILALAAGVVLGDNLARPFAKGPGERRRRNRRR
ncbi:hypothetical protein GCM10011512_15900 [Tersicoccus solisilvae]|uniref:Threonine/serine exporter family protein n=1 Tax=Tersicoccus solisilvae TaxID=1882339 RepID=A0ABQ1P395_9MICC|nr:threonine/serine exporter family protein [Tersicoccus solisilvae]GGC89762.1 hypothetical protein GCM10011512_15900 [Tersicoccus solisilvae]